MEGLEGASIMYKRLGGFPGTISAGKSSELSLPDSQLSCPCSFLFFATTRLPYRSLFLVYLDLVYLHSIRSRLMGHSSISTLREAQANYQTGVIKNEWGITSRSPSPVRGRINMDVIRKDNG